MSIKDKIIDEAHKFRTALELVSATPQCREFVCFPKGNCLSASVNLGVHLNKLHLGDFKLAVAAQGLKIHVWLVDDTLMIDITADQFDDEDSTVIVEKRGCSPWHDQWKVSAVRSIDAEDMEICGVREISEVMQTNAFLDK
ncbi:MAG: hypothetical protein OCD01_20175 [Fibrobacterales bacterium]